LTNNDIFRRIRYTFDLKDNTIVDICYGLINPMVRIAGNP